MLTITAERATGVEPSAEIVASADEASSCQHDTVVGGANTVHGNGSSCHFQTPIDPTLQWVLRHWNHLPPLVFELIQLISTDGTTHDSDLGEVPRGAANNAIGQLVWTAAKRCRSIVQGYLREEEWLDADQEFRTAIEDEILRSLTRKRAAVLPIEGSIVTYP